MENIAKTTVRDLRSLAKQRGLKGYSRLRKAELIQLLSRTIGSGKPLVNIMDEPVPTIGTAPLIPQSVRRGVKSLKDMTAKAATKVQQKISDFANWIMDYVPTPKAVDSIFKSVKDKIMALYSTKQKANKSILREQAARGWFKTYEIPGLPKHNPKAFMEIVKPDVLEVYRKSVLESGIKTTIYLFCEMEKTTITTGETIVETMPFPSDMEIILESTDTSEVYNTMSDRILENMAGLNARGSNWIFRSVVRMDISIDKYQPLGGSSWIDLPKWIKDKKAVVNPKNEDNECFKWAVLASLFPVERKNKNPGQVTNYKEHVNKVSWDGVEFPADTNSIITFEKANPDIAANVLAYEGRRIYPWYQSTKQVSRGKTVNLLLVTKKEDDTQAEGKKRWIDGVNSHYACVRNMSRLLSSQINGHKESKHFCMNCMNSFKTSKALKKHQKSCLANKGVAIEFPDIDEKIKFKMDYYR